MTLRRIASMLLLAAAGALVWAVAPALSTEPHRPAAVDFEQPVPPSTELRAATPRNLERAASEGGYGAHGPVLYRSEPITAPHRFDLAGIAGNLHAYEYRARDTGGEWGRWTEADNGDPVYTGGSDQLQIRSRNRPIRGTLHYVDITRDTAVAGGADAARRASREPDFITRREWGAKQKQGGCEPRDKPDMGRIKAGVIHHTVSSNNYSEAEAPGIVLGICRFHRNGNGWDDIGYNALVDRFGNVYQGRAGGMSRAVIGAHAEGVNTQTTGVAAIGDFTRKKPSKELQRSIVQYLAWKLDISGVSPEGTTFLKSTGGPSQKTPKGERVKVKTIFNHGTTNYTDCAGAALNRLVPKIRKKVARKIG
ncbi:MAG: N-acetylmuramoyl-L-alanine amidase [Solirubrobacterales bacterium]